MREHRLEIKVYLEDTDAEGIVYYANYFKYIERARSDMFEQMGLRIVDSVDSGRSYVVHEVHAKYHRSARLGDRLVVMSKARRQSDYRVSFEQQVQLEKDAVTLVSARVEVVCIDRNGNLMELPDTVRFDEAG